MTLSAIAESSAIFHAEIPALQCGDRVDYYFTAEYDSGVALDPLQGASKPYQAIVEIRPDRSRIRASDRRPFDFFGFDVDLDGDVAVVGAFQEDEEGFDSGAVYVFRVSASGEWEETAKLTHPSKESLANFGYSVAIRNDVLIAGAIGDDERAHNAGAAYVFRRSARATWSLQGMLTALDGESGDLFGAAVDTEGDLAVVGAPGNDTAGSNAGAVYIYSTDESGQWTQEKRILAEMGGSGISFGKSVSISGNTLALGAPGHSSSSGVVHIYHRTSPGQWELIIKLSPPEPNDGSLFGSSVHLNGDQLIVGAIQDHEFFNNVGAAYVFRLDPDLGWVFDAKLTAPDQRGLDEFGSGVAVEGDLAVVGARRSNAIGIDSGAVYIYIRGSDGAWLFEDKIVPEGVQPRINLGNALALSEGLAIVGAWIDGEDSSVTGSAYLIRPVAADCDGNGIADSCDIAAGALIDHDGDGVPDVCQCPGDLNGDRLVNTADLGILISQFGTLDAPADLNLDDVVDQADLGLLLLGFGLVCTPN